jgi:monofunctional biosynthetic peptidoglycan transglycosylase
MTRRKAPGLRRILRWLLFGIALWVVVTLTPVIALRWIAPPTSAVMWLEPGPVADIDYHWVDRAAIARQAALAVIAAEDQKFLSHHGIDFESLRDAISDYRDGDGLRGASTITQQVAKNLFLWNGRSFFRKVLEGWFTVLIELCWPKERILEVYLNVAEFGAGVFGIEAAAERYLGKEASRIGSFEAALLAAVLPSPKRMRADRPSVYVRGRQTEIAFQMRLLEERGHYRGLDW